MRESTGDDEYEQAMVLMRVIEKQPKLFAKWTGLKEKFRILGWADGAPAKEPTFFIEDALRMINEAFDNDGRQPALID